MWNWFKGPSPGGFDPESDDLTPLFHPRTDVWEEHFEWNGPELSGKTAKGRVTIELLRINLPERVEHRRLLMASGLFPLA